MNNKTITIIGAGPGGLSAAMLLAHKGYNVHVYEKDAEVGGRNGSMTIDGYTFDIGPTFFMMPFVLEEIFLQTGRKVSDYVDLQEVDPMYHLNFASGKNFYPTRNREAMKLHIEQLFPGDGHAYEKFMRDGRKKFERVYPCLKATYLHWWNAISKNNIKALPHLDLGKNVYDVMSKYFSHEEMRISMTFQAKYLGMSPWQCPGFFAILPFIEHEWGIWHPTGGLNQLSKAMAKVATEEGATIHLNCPVKNIRTSNGDAIGITLESGEEIPSDVTIINADFGYAATTLIPEADRKRWTNKAIAKKKYSCSTFMLYLGLDTQYKLPHHNIFFANDYKKNVEEIVGNLTLSEDFSFYVQNPWQTDSTLAPAGHSTIYVLVPVPNLTADTDWKQIQAEYTERVLQQLETRAGMADIRSHITVQKCITPLDWQNEANVYKGAVFNMGHQIMQMLHRRPPNKFDDLNHCYLVGGGTHPGSGLPTIIESGSIAAKLIEQYEQ